MRGRSSPGRRCCAQLFLKSRGGSKRTPVPQKLVSPGGEARGRGAGPGPNLPGARPGGRTGLSWRGQSSPRRQFGHGRGRASCRPPLGRWALCQGGGKRHRAGNSSSARPETRAPFWTAGSGPLGPLSRARPYFRRPSFRAGAQPSNHVNRLFVSERAPGHCLPHQPATLYYVHVFCSR